jgi:hypothetical protein
MGEKKICKNCKYYGDEQSGKCFVGGENVVGENDTCSQFTTHEEFYGWGGAREGAGRPSTGRKQAKFFLTDEEKIKVKEFIEQLRKPSQ